jgi:hypothetical protein
MLRFRGFAPIGCALAVSAMLAHAQETNPKAIVRKAIAAHGGEKELNKFQAGTSKYKGTMKILNQNADVTAETSFQKPDKFKNVMSIDILGKTIDVATVYDGKSLWVSAAGNTQEIKDEKVLNEVRESLRAEGGSLVEILKEPFELALVGEVKVKDKDTIGVRVSKKGQRDISYYFDKKTNLLAKTEMRSYQPTSGQEVNQEKIIVEYQDKSGLKVGKRVEILHDGQPFMNIEITDVQILDKLDDSIFVRP